MTLNFEKTKTVDEISKSRVTKYTWGSFNIEADMDGLKFTGFSKHLTTEKDLQSFAKAVSVAWAEHKRLTPKLDVTLN